MPLRLKHDQTVTAVAELAPQRGTSKQAELRQAVEAHLRVGGNELPLRERFAALRRADPLPARTRRRANKAFFDELSGENPWAGEPEADALSDRLDLDSERTVSSVSVWEAVAGLCRTRGARRFA